MKPKQATPEKPIKGIKGPKRPEKINDYPSRPKVDKGKPWQDPSLLPYIASQARAPLEITIQSWSKNAS